MTSAEVAITFAPVPEELRIMLYWIRERELVRKAKAAGLPKPWTQDPLFQQFRWCNVSRNDDRVTVDLMRHWYSEAPPATQLVAAVLGRLVNWPESLLESTGGQPFRMEDLPKLRPALKARANRKEKVFTGAYVCPGVPGMNKVDSTLDLAETIAAAASEILQPTLRGTWEKLIQFDGLASFLAGQMTADLAHLSAGAAWPDTYTWAPVGPGSARGMNRLLGRPKDKTVKQAQFDVELPQLIALLRTQVPEIVEDRRLDAISFQGLCCEFDKARRLQLGEGTVRAGYDGAGQLQGSLL